MTPLIAWILIGMLIGIPVIFIIAWIWMNFFPSEGPFSPEKYMDYFWILIAMMLISTLAIMSAWGFIELIKYLWTFT